jgi:hypothetical protein
MPRRAKLSMPADRPDRGEVVGAVVLSPEESRKVERFEDRPAYIARQRRLERQRREHETFLASLGIARPRHPIVVEPPAPKRRRPRSAVGNVRRHRRRAPAPC